MPRYFFDLSGEAGSFDEEGTDCSDFDRAQVEAIRLMGEMLRDNAETLVSIDDFGVVVRDSEGRRLACIQTSIGSGAKAPVRRETDRTAPALG